MRNKKLISLVIIALIFALSIMALITKYDYSKASESNIESINEIVNNIESTNEIQDVIDMLNQEQESIVLESEQKDAHEVEKSIQNTLPEKETPSVAKKENKKKEVQKTQVKQENVSISKTQDKKVTTNIETSNIEQPKSISQNNNNYTEKEVKVAPKTECIGNNHKMGAGNTGKWFETKAQADSYYNTEIDKWGKKWESGEIKKPEYLEKCPFGYEVWTCPQCGKWTINFYYR